MRDLKSLQTVGLETSFEGPVAKENVGILS